MALIIQSIRGIIRLLPGSSKFPRVKWKSTSIAASRLPNQNPTVAHFEGFPVNAAMSSPKADGFLGRGTFTFFNRRPSGERGKGGQSACHATKGRKGDK